MFTTFTLSMFIATFILLAVTRLAAKRLIHQHHAQKVDFFRQHPIQAGDIVFLGDSLTDGGRWDEIFPGKPVKNRGINADTTAGVFARLEDIIIGHPSAIFILIGTNDLPRYEYRSDEEILASYKQILEKCKAEIPDIRVYVQSLLPRHNSFSRRIQKLNLKLKELTEQIGYTYIDLFPAFSDSKGGLRREITNDDLHLLGPGYKIWADLLRPYIDEAYPVGSHK
jgi:lysophospholipase L1-like esterase